ncbi:M48 family metallopeptidase [Candidatus Thiodiazotropha sp. LNASS1]|uniref:M48 family metallopeptidase n=1 Tax=Candidatus Thiodiazotropha sp. LNASS1 TaxID=3096260 RepID=UPI003490CDAE
MNFFEHQDQAKRNTRRLVLLFLLAVVIIVITIDAVLLLLFGNVLSDTAGTSQTLSGFLTDNSAILLFGSGGTGAAIGLASLFRSASLKDGGGAVARQMGGVPVEADPKDPLRQRLRNVVEEIAIASGVPVPEIYIMEQESGINAFAAGYSPSDAAVAVTRGTLENLNREELQGVIAHEFSHIFNGDMRLNIRLIGALFGIMILAIAGRRILSGARFSSSSKNNNAGAIILFAAALTAIGYIGLFFARWIKAAVSRQREYLADASAVQFTRNPQGIAGALKKIAAHSQGASLTRDSEEIAHMLFGQGMRATLFATHPPIIGRIQRIEPGFREQELGEIAKRMLRRSRREAEREAAATQAASAKRAPFDPRTIIEGIGRPGWEQIMAAAALAATLPESLVSAARSTEWAPELLLCILLDKEESIRDQQLFAIARRLGAESETQVRYLMTSAMPIQPEQRLPLLEIAFPALKRRPVEFIHRLLDTVTEIVHLDGKIEVFEFLLAKVISLHLTDALNPAQSHTGGNRTLADQAQAVRDVIAILADHGHKESELIHRSYENGINSIGLEDLPMQRPTDWVKTLDMALDQLDDLKNKEKERLITALMETILTDTQVTTEELELLRAIGSALHIPLPLMSDRSVSRQL